MAYYRPRDKYFLKAKLDKFRARSIYKLQEMDRRFNLLKPGMRVLDLGAFPGSWTQHAAPRVKEVVAIDLKPLEPLPQKNITVITGDAFKTEFTGQFDVILSDMQVNTIGIKEVDQQRAANINLEVMKIAQKYLKPGGTVVSKIIEGTGTDEVIKRLKAETSFLKLFRPSATRRTSRERYLVYKLK